jgi:hypothetical protein
MVAADRMGFMESVRLVAEAGGKLPVVPGVA